MPINVICPNGCSLRLPSRRCGTTVRCSVCKASIQIPETTDHEQADFPLHAVVASPANPTEKETEVESNPAPEDLSENSFPKCDPPACGRVASTRAGRVSGFSKSGSYFRTSPPVGSPPDSTSSVSINIDDLNIRILSRRNPVDDHLVLTRFYSLCLATLGFAILIPAVIYLIRLDQSGVAESTPRWVFLLIFVGVLHVIYSIFLVQIADWSALWAISILMLLAACLCGLFSAAIALDNGRGIAAGFLQISYSQQRSAAILCLIGLCVSVLVSYLCGREAQQWQRLT